MTGPTRESLLESEQAHVAALLKGDADAVQKRLHAEYQISNPTVRATRASDFVKALRSGALKYRAIQHKPADVKIVNNSGVIVGQAEGTAELNGVAHSVQTTYCSQWMFNNGDWVLLHTHTGDITEPAREATFDKRKYRGILEVQHAHTQALLTGSEEALRKAMHPLYSSFTHDGRNVPGDQLIKAIATGELKYERIDYHVDNVRVQGNVAVVISRTWGSGQFQGKPFSAGGGCCSTFINIDRGDPAPDQAAGWQLLSAQVSNLAVA
jgi:hypothetical protein